MGSSSAIKVVSKLGFTSLKELSPGEITHKNHLKVKATAGPHVPQLENGYLLSHPQGSIYIEPHGYLDSKIIKCIIVGGILVLFLANLGI